MEATFAEGPARDSRFDVKERWVECENFPQDHPLREIEFIHRQMNEEVNGLECSARALSDFPDADWELRMWLARQCADEARHARVFRSLLERRGGHVGQFPVLNFQYRIINAADTLVGRLTIQNRSFEAGGIDAVSYAADDAASRDDAELAELFDAQLADEIVHVRFANEWIRKTIEADPSTVMKMGTALLAAQQGFAHVMGVEATHGVGFSADREARLEAGFTEKEVALAENLAATKVASEPGR